MIKYLYINNYKSFVNFRVDFSKKNLLLGKNGTGKSTIFLLIATLRNFVLGNGVVAGNLFFSNSATRWMNSSIQTFEIGLSDGDDLYTYRLEIEYSKDPDVTKVKAETVSLADKPLLSVKEGVAFISDGSSFSGRELLVDSSLSALNAFNLGSGHKELSRFRELMSKIVYCSPYPRNMVDRVENDVYWPLLDFSNIASAYTGIVQLYPDIQQKVNDAMREINPAFKRTRVSAEPYGKFFVIDYQYKDVECSFSFGELSDGEKMLFALYALIYGYVANDFVVLLDEPDNYVSLKELQPWCTELEHTMSENGQCLLISHNAEIIDYMAEADGIWFSRLSSGESQVISNPLVQAAENQLLPYSELIARGLDE
nr:AAA family ATPase [uncultured Butyrivibrio sp.]